MKTIQRIRIFLMATMFMTGCTYHAKYRNSQLINFEKDYPRLLKAGEISHWDSVASDEVVGTIVYIYRPGAPKMYQIDKPLTKEMGEILRRDLKQGEVILDTKGARSFIRKP